MTIDGRPMDKGWFDALLTGDKRAVWFLDAALRTKGWENPAPDKPDLTAIPALKSSKFEDVHKQWVLAWSCDHVELSKHDKNDGATKAFAKAKIHELVASGIERPAGATSSANRSELLKALCEMREKEQLTDPTLAQEEPVNMDIEVSGWPGWSDKAPALPENEARLLREQEAAAMMEHPIMRGF